MSKNGGFPPIQYIIENNVDSKQEFKKERFYTPEINKHLDIKHILSQSLKKQMIELNVNRIDIIKLL